MKKLLTAILCLVLSAVMLFGFAACEQNPQALQNDLIGSLENATNETQNFEATLSAVKNGKNVASAKILGYGSQDNLNADIYFQEYDLGVMVLRNNTAYVATLDTTTTVAPEKLQSEVERLVYNNPDVIFTKLADDVLDGILGGSGSTDISGILEYVSEEDLAKITEIAQTLSHNLMSLLFNKAEKTDNGYVLSMDLNKLYQDLWNKVYAVAAAIDENNKITVSELYASKPVQEILSLFLNNVSGKQVEYLLGFVSEIPEVMLPFELLPANDKETAIDYIGRYLETIKIEGTLTIGAMRISDLISASGGRMPDLTDELDKLKTELDKELSEHLQNDFVCELRFDNRKKLVGAKIAVKEMGTAMEYDEISVEVSLLDKQPQLLDATKLNSVSISDVKVTNCADNLFYEDDFTDFSKKYFTLKDGDLSASIFDISSDNDGLTIFVEKGTSLAFKLELSKENGIWTVVDTDDPHLNYDGQYGSGFSPKAECTANDNNILVSYSLLDSNGTSVLDFNFSINWEPIAH